MLVIFKTKHKLKILLDDEILGTPPATVFQVW